MIKNIILRKSFWIIFLIYNLLILNSGFFSFHFFLLSIGIFFLNVLPLYNFYINYKRINHIPLYYFTHVYFFSCYTSGLFFPSYILSILENNTYKKVLFSEITNQSEIFINAGLIYLIGLFFFNLANFIFSFFFKKKFKENNFFDFKTNYYEILLLGISSYLLSLLFIFFGDFEILRKLYQAKYPLIYLSLISIHLFVLYKNNLNILFKVILYFFIFLILFLEILNGSVATSFLYLIAIYLVNIIVTKKINFIFSFSIILVCVLLHTFKYEYRNATWGKAHINASLANVEAAQKENEKSQRSTLDKSKILITTYSNSFLNLKNNKLANSMETFKKRNFKRLTHSFNSLVVVSYLSPQHVPHWNGYSYKIFASKFIPRIFWDGKPSDTLGNGFGKRYKILNNIDRTTSWNMPVLNEFFVNFGSVGVMIGMFLLGSIFTLVPLLLNYRYNNYLFVITFITLYPLFYLESHFSLTFGAVFQTFIFLLVYVYFFKKFLSFMRGFFNF